MKIMTARMVLVSLCALNVYAGMKETVKIVTISRQEVALGSETGQGIQVRIQEEQEKMMSPLQKEAESIQKTEQELIKYSQSATADQNELAFKKSELGLRAQKLQADGQKAEAKISELYGKLMKEFEKSYKEVVADLSKKNGWSIVMIEETTEYADPALSITKQVIEELDNRAKAAKLAKKQAIENKAKDAAKA